jgi:hypothetical protein
LIVGAIQPSRIEPTAAMPATAPAAPSMCPTIDFGAEIASLRAWSSPNARLMARVSVTSLSGVEVPWATTWSISSGATSAWRMAFVMAIAAPRPVGSGAEMWYASAVSEAPTISARIGAPRAAA